MPFPYTLPFVLGQKAETLTDDFTTKDTTKWTWSASATVVSGQASLTPAGGSAEVDSNDTYDLLGSFALVEAVSLGSAGNSYLDIYAGVLNVGNYAAITKQGSNLLFRESVSGTPDDTSIAYDATAHRWWRIRESGGTIFWDTSPDSVTWTNRRSKVTTLDYGSIYAQLYVDGASGTSTFDNFNIPSVATTNTGAFFVMF